MCYIVPNYDEGTNSMFASLPQLSPGVGLFVEKNTGEFILGEIVIDSAR